MSIITVNKPSKKCLEDEKRMKYLRRHSRDWRTRLFMEYAASGGFFVTLTFDDDNLPKDNDEGKAELQKFNKRVRVYCERYKVPLKNGYKFYGVSEHGDNGTQRLHFHIIMFGFQKKAELEAVLSAAWKKGFFDIGRYCNQRSFGYVCKYIHKRVLKDNQEFALMSHGIGDAFLTDELIEYYRAHPSRRFFIRGQKYIFPRRYLDLLYKVKFYTVQYIDSQGVPQTEVLDTLQYDEFIHNVDYVQIIKTNVKHLPRIEWQHILTYDEKTYWQECYDNNRFAPDGQQYQMLDQDTGELIPVCYDHYLKLVQSNDASRQFYNYLHQRKRVV